MLVEGKEDATNRTSSAMSYTAELEQAERRLARMINHRADSEEREVRADKAARVRADDAKCQSLMAEFQEDFRQFGTEPPLVRSDEWSDQYQVRLLKNLQRKLSPSSDLADSRLLDNIPRGPALENFTQMIRSEARSEAKRPSFDNLPETLDDPRSRLETVDPNSGARKIEWRAKRSFIADMNMAPKTVVRIVDPRTQNVLFGRPFDKAPAR
jgi:hypothetical protein